MKKLPIAAQMYTVREAAAANFPEALKKVANLGYDGVELAGTFNTPPPELARLLDDLGLRCISAHVPLADLKERLAEQIDTYLALGAGYLACPWLAPEERGGEADYRALAETLNRIGEQCRANGLQLVYHHHDFELERFGDVTALDILLQETDPANMQLEVDTYWLAYAGFDPAEYIKAWPGRVPLLHLKDMTATQPPTFAEVGAGVLAWPPIFAAVEVGATQWYVVEQDTCSGDPFDSLRLSIENLRRW